jgi:hypothetical protein
MARREADREDLFAEATALVRRAELIIRGGNESIVFGFKRDASLSVYFASDPVFHFDPSGRLRRAFIDGCLYRTQGHTLAELIRERTETRTVLRRRDLDPQELSGKLGYMRARFIDPVLAIAEGRLQSLKLFPEADGSLPGDFVAFVSPVLRAPDAQLLAPRIKGKR